MRRRAGDRDCTGQVGEVGAGLAQLLEVAQVLEDKDEGGPAEDDAAEAAALQQPREERPQALGYACAPLRHVTGQGRPCRACRVTNTRTSHPTCHPRGDTPCTHLAPRARGLGARGYTWPPGQRPRRSYSAPCPHLPAAGTGPLHARRHSKDPAHSSACARVRMCAHTYAHTHAPVLAPPAPQPPPTCTRPGSPCHCHCRCRRVGALPRGARGHTCTAHTRTPARPPALPPSPGSTQGCRHLIAAQSPLATSLSPCASLPQGPDTSPSTRHVPGDLAQALEMWRVPLGALAHPLGTWHAPWGHWQGSWRHWRAAGRADTPPGDGDTPPGDTDKSLGDPRMAPGDTLTALGPRVLPGDPIMPPGTLAHCWGP